MRIPHSIKYVGQFWIPEHPDRKVAGDLSIAQSGAISLCLNGNLHDAPIEAGPIPRIIGSLDNAQYITLDDCFYTSERWSREHIAFTELHVHKAVVGAKIAQGEVLKTTCFRFSVEGLDDWLGIECIKVVNDYDSGSVNVSYIRPNEIVIPIPEDLVLKFSFSYTPPCLPAIKSATIQQKVMIELHSVELREIEAFIAVATQIKDLLCLLIDSPISFDHVTIALEERPGTPFEGHLFHHNCYFEDVRYSEADVQVSRHRMLCDYQIIADGFPSMVNRWIETYNKSHMAFVLFFHTYYKSIAKIDEKLLSLAQGLESIHRCTSDETRFSPAEFRQLKKWLREACPPSRVDWLEQQLGHGNAPTLAMRLDRLMLPFSSLFGDDKKQKDFLIAVKNTRNELTHPGGTRRVFKPEGDQLWLLQRKAHVLFQLNLLLILGLNPDQIIELARKNRAMQFALSG